MEQKMNLLDFSLYKDLVNFTPLTNCCLNVTNACNLACTYCFVHQKPENMTLDTAKDALRFMIENAKKAAKLSTMGVNTPIGISFFGGEPMLRYNDLIKPLVEWSDARGYTDLYNLQFGMTTNCTLLNEENLSFMKAHNMHLLTSIDGPRNVQDDQRPYHGHKSSFDTIEPLLDTILKYYPYVTFRSTITPRNVGTMLDSYLYVRSKNFMSYFNIPNAYEYWSEEAAEELCNQIFDIGMVFYRDILTGNTPLYFSPLAAALRNINMQEYNNGRPYFKRCGLGTTSIGIATDGSLFGCQEHNSLEKDIFYIGDIYNGINETLHRRLLGEFSKLTHPTCKEDPDRCSRCNYSHLCNRYFCPSHNMGNNGEILQQPKISCVYHEILMGTAQYIKKISDESGETRLNEYLRNNFMQSNGTTSNGF